MIQTPCPGELPMHEFGITERLLHVAISQADLRQGETIQRLNIALDPHSGYAPDAIRFYFEQIAQNTPAEGAELAFTMADQPGRLRLTFADGFLLHDRPIAQSCDDSVIFSAQVADAPIPQIVRRSRGFAPLPLLLPAAVTLAEPLLATGADLKNVSALAADRHVFLTQHIGDLRSVSTRQAQERALADFETLFAIEPRTVVCDLHPDYVSRRYARQRAMLEDLTLLEVQHHHAHVAACLAEHDRTEPAIGLAFDGRDWIRHGWRHLGR